MSKIHAIQKKLARHQNEARTSAERLCFITVFGVLSTLEHVEERYNHLFQDTNEKEVLMILTEAVKLEILHITEFADVILTDLREIEISEDNPRKLKPRIIRKIQKRVSIVHKSIDKVISTMDIQEGRLIPYAAIADAIEEFEKMFDSLDDLNNSKPGNDEVNE